MANLSDIQHALAPDLDALNAIIEQTLHSDTPLMNDIVANYLRTKGKQLRPLLVLLAGRLFGGVNERVLHAGAAIEMLHKRRTAAACPPSTACGTTMWPCWWAISSSPVHCAAP